MVKVEHEKVIQILFKAIDEVNLQLPRAKNLKKSKDLILTGENSELDSLALVNLIVATEQKIEESFENSVPLAGEHWGSSQTSPFRTIESLAEYIRQTLEKKLNAS